MSSSSECWTWIVEGSIVRIDRMITDAIENELGRWTQSPRRVSRSQIQRLIEEGQVKANGKILKFSSKLSAGVEVQVTFPPPEPLDLIPEDRPLEILYEDKDILVVNKPPGLTVHPSDTQKTGTLVHALLHHVKDLSGIGGALRPGIVHRIDKDTSGALVITKSDDAHRKLVEVFSEHAIDRVYWALCYGTPAVASGKIESKIGRTLKDRKKMGIIAGDSKEKGRDAITHYKRIEEFGVARKNPFASWIEVTLETGRTHQVRVHLTSIGNSIFGDPVYGSPGTSQTKWATLPRDIQIAVQALPGQALHARVLGFEHPITGKKLHFEAEPPPAFCALMKALEKYGSK